VCGAGDGTFSLFCFSALLLQTTEKGLCIGLRLTPWTQMSGTEWAAETAPEPAPAAAPQVRMRVGFPRRRAFLFLKTSSRKTQPLNPLIALHSFCC
jgi:hypothetical protein